MKQADYLRNCADRLYAMRDDINFMARAIRSFDERDENTVTDIRERARVAHHLESLADRLDETSSSVLALGLRINLPESQSRTQEKG